MEVGQLSPSCLYAGMFFYEPIGRLHGLNQMPPGARRRRRARDSTSWTPRRSGVGRTEWLE